MIERGLKDLGFAVDPKRNAKQQALEALPQLQSKIPIRRARMRLKILVLPICILCSLVIGSLSAFIACFADLKCSENKGCSSGPCVFASILLYSISSQAVGALGEPSSLPQVNIANENDLHMLLRSEKADIEQTTFSGAQVSRRQRSLKPCKIWRVFATSTMVFCLPDIVIKLLVSPAQSRRLRHAHLSQAQQLHSPEMSSPCNCHDRPCVTRPSGHLP